MNCLTMTGFKMRPAFSYTITTVLYRPLWTNSGQRPVLWKRFTWHNVNKLMFNLRGTFCTNRTLDTPSNIIKDVIVFKYENPKFFRLLNIFGLSQFFFWNYLAHFSFTTLRDAPIEAKEDAAWWQRINLGENRYRNGITICCFLVGYGILTLAWMYTLRSVRFLILRKGAEDVSLVTYTPFGKNRIMTVPLKCISAQESRESANQHLPLKVKNKTFFYILDMKGQFLNQRLYDYTVGLKRNL